MIEAAERDGLIEPGRTTIVEATSGNTGIALAFVCAAKGYELVLTLPQGMSREREGLLRLYGARVQITESMGGMDEAVEAARTMAAQPDVFLPDQFSNPANPEIHRRTTGAGDPRGARRPRRRVRRRRRDRRDDHRRGGGPQGAQSRTAASSRSSPRARRCCRAGRPGRTRSRGSAPGFVPRGAQPRRARRDHPGRRRGRDRDGAPGRAARGRARRASRAARRCGRRWRSPRGRRCRASGSWRCCRTPASATSRRRSSRPSVQACSAGRDGRRSGTCSASEP